MGGAQREACATPRVSFLQEEPKELLQNLQRRQKGKADLIPAVLQARPLQGPSSEPLGKDDLIQSSSPRKEVASQLPFWVEETGPEGLNESPRIEHQGRYSPFLIQVTRPSGIPMSLTSTGCSRSSGPPPCRLTGAIQSAGVPWQKLLQR